MPAYTIVHTGPTNPEERSAVEAWCNAQCQLRDAAIVMITARDEQVPATALNTLRQAHAVAAQEYLYRAARLLDAVGGDVRFWLNPLGGIPLKPENIHALEGVITLSQEEMCRLFHTLSAASQLLQRERDQLAQQWSRSANPAPCKPGGA